MLHCFIVSIIILNVSPGLPAPRAAGADLDFVITEAEEPREGRVLIADVPLDHSSPDVASFRLPLAASFDDDVVVIEAAEGEGRSLSDIPRDRNFGIVAGPRLPLPDDDVVVVDVADGRDGRVLSETPLDHSAPAQAGFRLPLPETELRSLQQDEEDFEIIEVGDDDYDQGRSLVDSLSPTDNSGSGKAGFRLPLANQDDFIIVEAGAEEPRVSSRTASDCLKPLTVSRCRASLVNWFFNSETGGCEQFSFGGCDSDNHSNRFESEEECRQVCLSQ